MRTIRQIDAEIKEVQLFAIEVMRDITLQLAKLEGEKLAVLREKSGIPEGPVEISDALPNGYKRDPNRRVVGKRRCTCAYVKGELVHNPNCRLHA